jgi:hypothetical protein
MAARKPSAPLTVVDALERELEALGALAESALAASAMTLARELDKPGNSATSKSMCAKGLRETLDRLRELSPPKVERDRIDEVNSKGENGRRRRAGA